MVEEVANFDGRRDAHVEALDVLARRVASRRPVDEPAFPRF